MGQQCRPPVQMNLAVWYHCKMSGEGIPSQKHSFDILREQMEALNKSGLAAAAKQIHIGINGGSEDGIKVSKWVPEKSVLYVHGTDSRSELPTFFVLRCWLPAHREWAVFYHHSKGVTQPYDEFHHLHRRTMEKACVWNWKQCVEDLELGYDAVGVNLVHPIKRPVMRGRFFAGNFWWARASYLMALPPLPEKIRSWSTPERCRAEMWVGSFRGEPRFMDYERSELYR